MLIYIFKSVACMAILFVFYKLLLEKENMHVFKRYYLLLALGAALLIPALVFTEYVTVDPVPYAEIQQPTSPADYDPSIGVPEALEKDVLDIAPLLWGVYLIGFVFFGLRFIRNLGQIIGRIRKNPKQKSTSFVHVLLKENYPPHTFFKYIFLNQKKLESHEIPKEVLLHEETHAKQRHSWDVICIELLQVIFWFNPLVYLFKKAIKLNHEFLADQAVLNKDIDKTTYQNTLLSYLSPDSKHKYQSKMAHAINYSSIKKRFTVMKKNTSKTSFLLRSSLLLPLLALLLLGFSETKLIEVVTTEAIELEEKSSFEKSVRYDELDKKYNDVSTENSTDPLSEHLYEKTTAAQRQDIEHLTEQLPKNRIPKNVILYIHKNQILLNNQAVSLNSFSETINQHTKNWEETDYTSAIVQVNYSDTPVSFLKKVEDEFEKTHLSKANSQMKLFPNGYKSNVAQDGASRELMKEYNKLAKYYNDMPHDHMKIRQKDVDRLEYIYSLMSEKQKADAEPFPDFPEPPAPPAAPKAPKATKEVKEHNPPQPKAPKKVNEREEAALIIEKVIAEQDPYDINGNLALSPVSYITPPGVPNYSPSIFNYRPTPPKMEPQWPKRIQEPPSPPEPQSPLDHVIEMAKKGATFYFEGEEITSDKAIELLKNNTNLNIDSRGHKGKNPQVRISKNPITID